MADVGKSQVRQVGNSGNTPVGATGRPITTRGEAYYKFGSLKDQQSRPSVPVGVRGVLAPVSGVPSTQNHGDYIATVNTVSTPDKLAKVGKSPGLFGGSGGTGTTQGDAGQMPIPVVGTSVTHFYLMRARDPDCGPQPSYVYWVVSGTPDSTGASYTGSRCGIHALVEIVVEATWTR